MLLQSRPVSLDKFNHRMDSILKPAQCSRLQGRNLFYCFCCALLFLLQLQTVFKKRLSQVREIPLQRAFTSFTAAVT